MINDFRTMNFRGLVAPLLYQDFGEKNTMPITVYKGNVMSFIPLSPATGESYLVLYAKEDLKSGIYEFDMSTKEYKNVESVERADKAYFICIKPKRNTLAEAAMENL